MTAKSARHRAPRLRHCAVWMRGQRADVRWRRGKHGGTDELVAHLKDDDGDRRRGLSRQRGLVLHGHGLQRRGDDPARQRRSVVYRDGHRVRRGGDDQPPRRRIHQHQAPHRECSDPRAEPASGSAPLESVAPRCPARVATYLAVGWRARRRPLATAPRAPGSSTPVGRCSTTSTPRRANVRSSRTISGSPTRPCVCSCIEPLEAASFVRAGVAP